MYNTCKYLVRYAHPGIILLSENITMHFAIGEVWEGALGNKLIQKLTL